MQVFSDLCVVSYWIDTLVLKTEGNTYATLLHHPFLFKRNPTQAQEVAPRHNCLSRGFPRRGEGDAAKCSVCISLSFENQGINLVGDNAQVTEYLHKQSTTCSQRDKGVVNPFTVTCKGEIS